MPAASIISLEETMGSFGKKRVLAVLICLCGTLLASTALLHGEQPAKPQSTARVTSADAILDRYVAAVGGLEAWKKASTRLVRGTVELSPPLMTGKVELYQVAPDKMRFEMKIPRLGIAWVIVNGSEGWRKDFASDPQRLSGDELADSKIDADFYKEVDLRRLYPRIEYGGASVVDSRAVDIVHASTAGGRSHTLYFDKDTGLLVREDFVSVSARGQETVQTYFEDYRELKDVGIKYPFQVKQVTGRAAQTMHFEDVLHTVTIDSSLFAPPAP